MRHLLAIIGLVFMLSETACAGEYRNFTNNEGRTIAAQLLDYDAERGQVLLKPRNRKKSWIPLTHLCEADQVYVKEWKLGGNKPDSSNAEAKEEPAAKLSEEQIEAIVEQYEQAVLSHDFDALQSLFFGEFDISEEEFTRVCGWYKHLQVSEVDGHYVQIAVQFKSMGKLQRWMYLLDDGKIKYDPIFRKHPTAVAFENTLTLLYCLDNDDDYHRGSISRYKSELCSTQVPLTADMDQGRNHSRERYEQILEWLIENGAHWDATEPKIPCHEDVLREQTKRAKTLYI